jgi:inosine-uridine nucleoside N-ribohydrolase
LIATVPPQGQVTRQASNPTQKVIFDTDIGDDIDDVFALGLVLNSPELNVLGVTSAWGDTELRARLLQRFLHETGHVNIPVSVGRRTTPAANAPFTQAAWAQRMPPPKSPLPNAVDFTLDQIRKYPGEITLISVTPLTNICDLLDRDPVTFIN